MQYENISKVELNGVNGDNSSVYTSTRNELIIVPKNENENETINNINIEDESFLEKYKDLIIKLLLFTVGIVIVLIVFTFMRKKRKTEELFKGNVFDAMNVETELLDSIQLPVLETK